MEQREKIVNASYNEASYVTLAKIFLRSEKNVEKGIECFVLSNHSLIN